MPERRQAALLSLSDTTGAVALALALAECGRLIIATAGTKRYLERHGIATRDVESITGFEPLFDGRVKTLHPLIFGGILYDRDSPQQREAAQKQGIDEISVVAVTLYPPPEIDIGGVALLRAGAKNFAHVSVLCDPARYEGFVRALRDGGPTLQERRELAVRALRHVAQYDAGNAARMAGESALDPCHPERFDCAATQRAGDRLGRGTDTRLRYGENPHQCATFAPGALPMPEQLHGKALSYNNLLDLDAALRLLPRAESSRRPGARRVRAAVVKHTVPCGVAQRDDVASALALALDADRTSAYGGIVAIDAPLTAAAAAALAGAFVELVAA
ncbi:MAG: bifunctional phosphoribosylaminoimidazolecarboxamide formyltransferase/IMP cyclohydrolase, partial [Candidatus Tyrphobacter sp.]